MAESTIHTSEDMSGWYESRHLALNFPKLIQFLFQGATVLDVGCGPGTITLDVANRINPGTITGIDSEQELIQRATDYAKTEGVSNVTFVQGNAYNLPFAEHTFDIAYSRDVLHFLSDPICALCEQRRVTKPNGRIIAFAVDWGTFVAYPELPTVEKVIASWKHWPEIHDPKLFLDQFAGRKLFSYFSAAGIKETEVQGVVQRDYCVVFNSKAFKDWYPRLRMHFSRDGVGKMYYDKLLSLGILNFADLNRTMYEIENWYKNPNAFMSVTYFLAAGRA